MTGTSANPEAASSVATIATPNARKYLAQLCKHFQHKLPANFADSAGTIDFPIGRCGLRAKDGELKILLASPDAIQLTQLQDVVARHLVRFAFREELAIAWSGPEA
jgi:uncharacterized protein